MSENAARKVGSELWADDKLVEFLKPGKEQESKLINQFMQMKPGSSNLLIVSPHEYAPTPAAAISYFTRQNMPGVYVCVNRPYMDVIKSIGTPPSNIHFIDVVTSLTGKDPIPLPNVHYLDSPLALVEMNVTISEQLQKIASNQKFLFLDSISTLLVYNSSQAVEKFCHTVISKNRDANTIIILLAVNSEENKNTLGSLHQFVDQSYSIT